MIDRATVAKIKVIADLENLGRIAYYNKEKKGGFGVIPKIIHYVWLGGNKKPKLVQQCMKSWEKLLPEYQFICWDETKFDINSIKFVKQAYEKRLWAYASDYIRLHALYNYGGIYLDTDAKVLKPLNDFLDHRAFFGWENNKTIGSFIIGAEKKHPFILELLEYYHDRDLEIIPNVEMFTKKIKTYGIEHNSKIHQFIANDVHIYPQKTFCSRNYRFPADDAYTLHYFDGNGYGYQKTFWDKLHWRALRKNTKHELRQFIGIDKYNALKSFFGLKVRD